MSVANGRACALGVAIPFRGAVETAPLAYSTTYRDALADCRGMGNAELGSFVDARSYEAADVDDLYARDGVALYLAMERLRAGRDELDRRRRLFAAGRDVADPDAGDYAAWQDLARRVKEHADILLVFHKGGYDLKRAGSNGRRRAPEYAGACLVCAGRDRLRVWSGPNGRYWCRRCGLRGDVIAIAQTLLPECREWHTAVRYLAGEVGLPAPDEQRAITPGTATLRGIEGGPAAPFEFRGGRVVPR